MRELVSRSAISRVASVVIVVLIIAAAFGGYSVGSVNQRTSTYTTTLSAQTITTSTGGRTVTLTEHITYYGIYTYTYEVYSTSSSTYTCAIGTVGLNPYSSSTSLEPVNVTGSFTATVKTVAIQTVTGTTSIFRSTSSYPLGTTVTTVGNSTVTTTTCVIQM